MEQNQVVLFVLDLFINEVHNLIHGYLMQIFMLENNFFKDLMTVKQLIRCINCHMILRGIFLHR